MVGDIDEIKKEERSITYIHTHIHTHEDQIISMLHHLLDSYFLNLTVKL